MTTLRIKPLYGYGWSSFDATIDPPEPFRIEILETDRGLVGTNQIVGRVMESGHPLDRMFVILSLRTRYAGRSHYNLYADYAAPATLRELADKDQPLITQVTGFAEIEV
jgi:hypothetical protein